MKTLGNVTSVTLTPTALGVAKEMLKLAFALGLPVSKNTVTLCALSSSHITLSDVKTNFHLKAKGNKSWNEDRFELRTPQSERKLITEPKSVL